MGKREYNIDHVHEVVNNPLYTMPKQPQTDSSELTEFTMPVLRYNSNVDANTFLRSLPAVMQFPYQTRGNINPKDIQETPYRNKVSSWYDEHPDGQLCGFKNPNNEYLKDAFPINPNLSNYRKSYGLATDKAMYNAWRYGRSLQGENDMVYNIKYPQADVSTPIEAGKYIADYNRLRNAMSDWTTTLQASPYLDSFYDEANENDNSYKLWSREKDAKTLARALSDCNGDVQQVFKMIEDGKYAISNGAKNAILNMMGHDVNLKEIQKDKTSEVDLYNLKKQTAQRFFNAYNFARDNYDIDESRPSSEAYYGFDKEKYDDYMKQQAERDIVLRNTGQNQYARGGHLRTPNTIRSRNGLKMRRADDLGGADYDIYF